MGVVEEKGEEHVSTLRNFLETPHAEVQVVFISGHGLSKRPREWNDTWNFSGCRANTSGLPNKVKERASRGDIHVFSCGLLSPYWLNECLQTREEKRVNSTVVLILDSCYSGSWIKVLDEQLKENRLNHTKLIIQASCKSDQVAKGDFFVPLWIKLQTKTYAELQDIKQCDVTTKEPQVPDYFESRGVRELFPFIIAPKKEIRFFTGLGFRKFQQAEHTASQQSASPCTCS